MMVLRNNINRIDAVEIDPVIGKLGFIQRNLTAQKKLILLLLMQGIYYMQKKSMT